MSFVYPSFLFALSALAIPVIIHLFNFRRYKKIWFTNVRFLKDIKEQSEQKSKLRHLLILVARLLALASLVLAFAQPVIPNKAAVNTSGEKCVSIYVDNSFSMEAVNKNGFLLESAKKHAREIANTYGNTDKFQLLTSDFEGKHQRILSKEEFLRALDEVKISPSVRNFSEVLNRQQDAMSQSRTENKTCFVLSDFQKTVTDLQQMKVDSGIRVNLLPLRGSQSANLFIDTCWFDSPVQQVGEQQKLHVRIQNNSASVIENGSLKLLINGQQVAPSSFSVNANDNVEVVLSFLLKTGGMQQCALRIDDHPVSFDDVLYFSFYVEKQIPVLLINGIDSKSGSYFSSLMKQDSLFLFNEISERSIDFSSFGKQNLIIVNELSQFSSGLIQELKKFVSAGGSLVVFPAERSNMESYNLFFADNRVKTFTGTDTVDTKVDYLEFEDGLFEGVFEKRTGNMDLPKVLFHYASAPVSRSDERVLMRMQNGRSFLSYYPRGLGRIYIFSSPADKRSGNFTRHSLFVPVLIKMAVNSTRISPLYFYCGMNNQIVLRNLPSDKQNPFHIKDAKSNVDFIPEMRISENQSRLFTQGQPVQSGNFFIYEKDRILFPLSFNYSRKESNLDCYSAEELSEYFSKNGMNNFSILTIDEKSAGDTLAGISGGTQLWKWFIFFCLFFIFCEIVLIRLLK